MTEFVKCKVCGAYQNDLHRKQVNDLFMLWQENGEETIKLPIGLRVLCGRLIEKFTYDKVREAFIQASLDPSRMTVAYVRGILLKKEQQETINGHKLAAEKNRAEAEEFKKSSLEFSKTIEKYIKV